MNGIQQLMGQGQPQAQKEGAKSTISEKLMQGIAAQRAVNDKKKAMEQLMQEMQAKGQNPMPQQGGQPTVVEGLDQELVNLNSQEMVQRVAPTLQRKMSQEQQAMRQAPQRVAQANQQAQQANQQAQQAKQGLAQLQQQKMQQTQQRFRTGGIVQAFREGGDVPKTNAEQAKLAEQLRAQGLPEEEVQRQVQKAMGQKPELGGVAGFFRDLPRKVGEGLMGAERLGNYSAAKAGDFIGESLLGEERYNFGNDTFMDEYNAKYGIEDEAPEEVTTPALKTPPPVLPEPEAEEENIVPEELDTLIAGTGGTRQGSGQSMSVSGPQAGLEKSLAEIQKYEESIKEPEEVDIAEEAKRLYQAFAGEFEDPKDIAKARAEDLKYFNEITGYDERLSAFDNMLKTAQLRWEAANDPKTRKWSRISAFLRGFGGTTNIGSGFASASASRANQMEKNKDREEAAFNKMYEVFQDRDSTMAEQMQAGMDYAQSNYEIAMAERRQGISDMRALANTGMQVQQSKDTNYIAQKRAVLEQKMNVLTEQVRTAVSENEITSARGLAEVELSEDRKTQLLDVMQKLPEIEDKFKEMVAEKYQDLLFAAQEEGPDGEAAMAEFDAKLAMELQNSTLYNLYSLVNTLIQDNKDARVPLIDTGSRINREAIIGGMEKEEGLMDRITGFFGEDE